MSKDEKKNKKRDPYSKGNILTVQEQLEGKLFKERMDNERKQTTIDNLNTYIEILHEELAIANSQLAKKKRPKK